MKICHLTHFGESPEAQGCLEKRLIEHLAFSRSQVYVQEEEEEEIRHSLFLFSYWLHHNQPIGTISPHHQSLILHESSSSTL